MGQILQELLRRWLEYCMFNTIPSACHNLLKIIDFPSLQVCFSDESTFQILAEKPQYVKRRVDEKYHPDCIPRTLKHRTSVMIWSVISSKGLGRLYVVEGTMRQNQYKKVLMDGLLLQLRDWFPNDRKIFMQDSAPCHKAKSLIKFLEEENKLLLRWSGNSPDMNPIENAWECLKRELGRDNITTRLQLIERIIYHWNHNKKLAEIVQSCIKNMPRWIEALIAAKGGSTKYWFFLCLHVFFSQFMFSFCWIKDWLVICCMELFIS